ncbi:hypothetical protein ABVF61_14145 [Roseibium sp. HPY-6]|uniref:hypothetical protein n=1 Tax=Roseibium sp. HPY-6 TaxID=3229852 RepID=UPI00338F524B
MQPIDPNDMPETLTCHGIVPRAWQERNPNAWGNIKFARTNGGTPVRVWVPKASTRLPERYFCHGWATGTYPLYGYTPFSGVPMLTVLEEEWSAVDEPQVHDIMVWFEVSGEHAGMPCHSARVEEWSGNGLILSSKNGTAPLQRRVPLDEVDDTYFYSSDVPTERHLYRSRTRLPRIDFPVE